MPDTHIPVPPLEYNAKQKPARKRKAGRFLRGYLMTVGALTTVAALVWFVVWLLVQIENLVH